MFAVDDVVPASLPMENETLGESLARRFARHILALPESDRRVIRSEESANRCHPLIDAVHSAFARHSALTLSPDSIWLAIAQGFSHHIAGNAAALRHRLVRHQGRCELTEDVVELTPASFENAIAGFSAQIREASDPVLHATLLCDFTTTTPAVRTASEVVLMDSYSSYFEYEMRCICGIPRITVTGTEGDWERIRARVEVFEPYGLAGGSPACARSWTSSYELPAAVPAANSGRPSTSRSGPTVPPRSRAGSPTFFRTWTMRPGAAGVMSSIASARIGRCRSRRAWKRTLRSTPARTRASRPAASLRDSLAFRSSCHSPMVRSGNST